MNAGAKLGLWLLVTPLSVWFRWWTLCQLWLWLIVPQFGVKPLTLAGAAGITLIVGFLSFVLTDVDEKIERQKNDSQERKAARFLRSLVASPLLSVLALFFGWLYALIFS